MYYIEFNSYYTSRIYGRHLQARALPRRTRALSLSSRTKPNRCEDVADDLSAEDAPDLELLTRYIGLSREGQAISALSRRTLVCLRFVHQSDLASSRLTLVITLDFEPALFCSPFPVIESACLPYMLRGQEALHDSALADYTKRSIALTKLLRSSCFTPSTSHTAH